MEQSSRRREQISELILAVGVVLLGGLVVWQTTEIRLTPVNSRVGPRIIPYIVGIGLIVTGCWLTFDVLRGRLGNPEGGEDAEDADASLPTDWQTLIIVGAALGVYLLLIERAGFIIASATLFVMAAFAMGNRRLARDIAIGVILATVLYLVFNRGLGLSLPAGILDGIV
jgi:putative tricarboxylic transport membrane protein